VLGNASDETRSRLTNGEHANPGRQNEATIAMPLKLALDALDRLTETGVHPRRRRPHRAGSQSFPKQLRTRLMRPLTDRSVSHVRYASFAEFYPYYLSEHSNRTCRRLHFVGTTLVLIVVAAALVARTPWLLLLAPVAGYGFAWVGHFVFEKNRPATFSHPFYSLAADFVLFRDILTGRIPF
jgi:hypothetical protein